MKERMPKVTTKVHQTSRSQQACLHGTLACRANARVPHGRVCKSAFNGTASDRLTEMESF